MLNKKASILGYTRDKIEYYLDSNGQYYHNYDRDIQIILIWGGKAFEEDFIKRIDDEFNILNVSILHWSQSKINSNVKRLGLNSFNENDEPFLSIIYEDLNPIYKISAQSNSKNLICNINSTRLIEELANHNNLSSVYGSDNLKSFFIKVLYY